MKLNDLLYMLVIFTLARVTANYVYDKFVAPNVAPVVL